MQFRLWLVVVVLCGTTAANAGRSGTVVVEYASTSSTGYDSASFRASYVLHKCMDGNLYITTKFIRSSFQWSNTYWLDGTSHPTPPGLSPTVDDQGTFNGSVRIRGGGSVGTFRTTPGVNGAHSCSGDRFEVASLSQYVDLDDPAAVVRFLDSLDVIPDTNPTYRNDNVENAIRRKLRQDERDAQKKRDDEQKKRADKQREKDADEERRRREEIERIKKEEEDKVNPAPPAEDASDDIVEAARERGRKIAQEQAAAEAEREAKRKEYNDRAAARTDWTDADEHDTSGDYWPNSRCAWMDDRGFLHPPRGRHNCSPIFMKWLFAYMKEQLEQEAERLRREEEARRQAEYIRQMSGGTAEGMAMLGGAAALAPMVDAIGQAANRTNAKFPMSVDIEATARVVLSGGTGRGFSLRAPGLFYVHMGFASYDAGEYDRVIAYSAGLGVQLPLTPKITVRAVEIGLNVGGVRHLIDMETVGGGFNLRSGIVYRVVSGLAVSATLGLDTMGDMKFFTDVGLLWRFDLRSTTRYLIQ